MQSFGDFLKGKGYKVLSENKKRYIFEEPEDELGDEYGQDSGDETTDLDSTDEPSFEEEPEEMDIPEEPAQPNPARDNKGAIFTAGSEKELYDALINDNIEIDSFEDFKSRREITVYYEDRMFNIKLERVDNNIYQVQIPEDIKILEKNNIEGSFETIKKRLEELKIEVEESEYPDLRLESRVTAKKDNKTFTFVAKKISPRRYRLHIPVKILELK